MINGAPGGWMRAMFCGGVGLLFEYFGRGGWIQQFSPASLLCSALQVAGWMGGGQHVAAF